MVAFRTLVSSFLLPIAFLSQSVQASGLFDRDLASPLLQERAVVNGNICAEVDLTLLGITLARDVCICARAGAITPASLLTLNQQISANSGLLAIPINTLGGITNAVTRLAADTLPILLQQPTSCVYPANATPNACGSCSYVCDTGFTDSGGACCATGFTGCNGVCVVTGSVCCPAGQVNCNGQCVSSSILCCATGLVACGSQCVAAGTVCQSGLPVLTPAKRGINSASCPLGFDACRIPGSPRSKNFGAAFECINTASDLESCGGCVVPTLGRPQGQDCSAIANVDSAICQAGRCVIESCARGFTNNGSACVKTESTGRKLSGYWAALEQASHVILQE